ncbi:MAG TPA: phospho-N-acetylmuramoyl-pentapeptide-transferase, partial [Candidatus Hydrogenedentes bacterium]|nr:phospho-N-acetylmuramoyl-pentapeptide-transferase [Candidatus Hydrogenedentota bacterium]
RKTRPRRPINGVMLTVNVQDLLQQSPQERVEHAAKLRARIQELHTKLGVPGFKDLFIPLGFLYVLFVVLVVVSMSNGVNLTDGLDGLAAGVSVISIITYAAIAYIVSRADWSHYLFLTYVPEASELFVFGGALLGAGLGFLWFNSHPAEVFMGDTGSLSLGGAIAALALLTKQELLLPIVAGMFALEALSVVIQVASFKTTGRRVFRMAPLHHHFELLGWVETKVTMRFWIVALLFALMSLGTLKLR